MSVRHWTVSFLITVLVLCVTFTGCDNPKEGRKTAHRIEVAIGKVCGVTEGREAGGPRTITPIDLDGSDGPSGFLVTCLNGRVEYVEATE